MHFHLDDDEEPVTRKVRFHDLLEMLKGERLKNPRKKLLESHLLTSPENQKRIREADEVARKKKKRAINKAKLIKKIYYQKIKERKGLPAEQILYKPESFQQRLEEEEGEGEEEGLTHQSCKNCKTKVV